jgi:hypothetical protein
VNYHQKIKDLSKKLNRPADTLIALSAGNDPFYIVPGREAAARWAADLWHRLNMPTEFHYRGIHYRFVSQHEPILMVNRKPYENTLECWSGLCEALRDAHYLGLVPDNAYVERRSDLPIVYLVEPKDAITYVGNDEPDFEEMLMPGLPALVLSRPTIPQSIHLEIFVEKSTQNDIFLPIAQHKNLNLVTGVGEMTATRVREFVARAKASGRPVRILYVSDFDPAGRDMPISVAAKIQFELYRRNLDLDIQVRPIVLTHEQCVEYKLPRTPIKDSEQRAPGFEARFGAGATELDALEALHPGLLRELVEKEIDRYWDPNHDDAIDATCQDIEDRLAKITAGIHDEHGDEIDALQTEWQRITNEYLAWVELAKPVWQTIRDECDDNEPSLDDVEWVEPFEADEDPDPLFDSTRDYVTQVDRFKRHQGKPIASKSLRQAECVMCGAAFEARHPSAKTCGSTCRQKLTRKTNAQNQRAVTARTAARRAARGCHTSDRPPAIGDICDGARELGGGAAS